MLVGYVHTYLEIEAAYKRLQNSEYIEENFDSFDRLNITGNFKKSQ